MQLFNDKHGYGLVNKCLHWSSALCVFFMFALGYWMDTLDYYSSWYKTAPDIHRSVGVLFVILTIARLLIKISSSKPEHLANHKIWERRLAKLVHGFFYLAIFSLFISGYLITTSTGQSLYVFNWFSLPPLIISEDNLEDLAGNVHYWIAYAIMVCAVIHAAGALKHHFSDRDSTLRRMLFGK